MEEAFRLRSGWDVLPFFPAAEVEAEVEALLDLPVCEEKTISYHISSGLSEWTHALGLLAVVGNRSDDRAIYLSKLGFRKNATVCIGQEDEILRDVC